MRAREIPLRLATETQLLEELCRRRNEAQDGEDPPQQWCDECAHFKFGTAWEVEHRPTFNPCLKKHAMKLWVPQVGDDPHVFGYYMPVCADRMPRPEPTPPGPKAIGTANWQTPPPRGSKPRRV